MYTDVYIITVTNNVPCIFIGQRQLLLESSVTPPKIGKINKFLIKFQRSILTEMEFKAVLARKDTKYY